MLLLKMKSIQSLNLFKTKAFAKQLVINEIAKFIFTLLGQFGLVVFYYNFVRIIDQYAQKTKQSQ
jgi:hypothetical protein